MLSLTIRELAVLTSWIDGGMMRGDPADLPPSKAAVRWAAGEPDVALTLPEQRVPLDDQPRTIRVDVAAPSTATTWLRGFDVVPGARTALRSVMLFVKTPHGERWLGGWTPWHAMIESPDVTAQEVPGGATLVAELHYKGWAERGGVTSDRSALGLYFSKEPAPRAIQQLDVTATATAVGTRRRLRGEAILDRDGILWALRPRLERDGAAIEGSIEVSAVRPGGAIEPVLWVKDNRPDWQLPYVLRDPADDAARYATRRHRVQRAGPALRGPQLSRSF